MIDMDGENATYKSLSGLAIEGQSKFRSTERLRHASAKMRQVHSADVRPPPPRSATLYVQTWLPLLSISLTAAICFGVASFVMGQAKPRTHTHPFWECLICLNEARSVLSILSIIIAKQPEEGWVMTYMELHFSVRLLIVVMVRRFQCIHQSPMIRPSPEPS